MLFEISKGLEDLISTHKATMTINMTALNLKTEPYSAIYPYVLLSVYRLPVCHVVGQL